MVTRRQEMVAVGWKEVMAVWQEGSQRNEYPGLTLSTLQSASYCQTKPEASGKGKSLSGLHSLASQGTEQGGERWRVYLEGQRVKAQ